MKKYFVLIFSLISLISAAQTSIYDIQYTQVPGSDGYYPSPLAEQYVTTGGIVSGINFDTDHYFISSSNGGAWNGIYIYDDTHFPAVGDSIILSGQVWEYHGLTEIRDVSSFETISSNNPLSPVSVSTDEINNQEAFESVFVTVTDISVSSQYNEWSEWQIDDGSGECFIGIGFLDLEGMSFPLVLDYPFDSISGIVSYSWGNFLLNPRNEGDLDPVAEGYLLSLNSNDIHDNSGFEVPVFLSLLEESAEINSYQLDFQYDPGVVSYFGFEENGTLSETGLISEQLNGNEVTLNFSGNFSFIGVEQLIKLNFNPLNSGDAGIDLISANLNEIEVNFFSVEQINIILENDPIGDTLTVIQRPLLNIPSIVTPGEDLEIICLAPETTSNWNAELIHNNKTISLNNIQAEFDPNLQRWFLSAVIPEPEIYELYDLRITASGNIEDVTANAVGILPEIKDEYYFVHITDTHLPTHYFYPDEESLTDTSEIVDLREVIKDINLIKPEFVLLTGDLVNEGELEDFENRRCFTKAQRLLEELEVPLYLVAGNHDLGGWNDTPPPQGTSRRNWWRFFGWNWLSDPPDSDPYYTQNYSFDYGPVHFTGMESYLNYDYFMYNIYGYESFISSQLDWLENDLQNAEDSEAKVLFYHMDFSDQIDLSELGVDMSLWGHIHSDDGNIHSHPYNLATENTCDGDRAYRLIIVTNAELDPQYTSHAGWDGNNININYHPSNEGIADSVSAIINNQQNLDFEHSQIKFIMPPGNYDYIVENGILEQIDDSGEFNICYVSAFLSANSETEISCRSVAADFDDVEVQTNNNLQIFPNPATSKTTIKYLLKNIGKTKIEIFNIKGQLIDILINKTQDSGNYTLDWDVRDLNSGIYFMKFTVNGFSQTRKFMVMK